MIKNKNLLLSMCFILLGALLMVNNQKGMASVVKYRIVGENILYVDDEAFYSFFRFTNEENVELIDSGVKWTSSDKKIAVIDKYGIVIAKKRGNVKISGSYKGNKVSFTISIKDKQLNFKNVSVPLNQTVDLRVLGGEQNFIKDVKATNSKCIEMGDYSNSTSVELKAVQKGSTKLTLITAKDNKKYTTNIKVIDPLLLDISNLKREKLNGKAVMSFTLHNNSTYIISSDKKIGALGDEFGYCVCYLKSNVTIKPGESKRVTIISDYSIKEKGMDRIKDMSPGMNIKYGDTVYAVWFDTTTMKMDTFYMVPFEFFNY